MRKPPENYGKSCKNTAKLTIMSDQRFVLYRFTTTKTEFTNRGELNVQFTTYCINTIFSNQPTFWALQSAAADGFFASDDAYQTEPD